MNEYTLLLAAPGGGRGRDVTQLVQSLSWSGSIRQTARELTARLAVPREGGTALTELAEGAALILMEGETRLFTGQLLDASTDSRSSAVQLSALDGGRFLAGNQGWYRFTGSTPEEAAAQVCRDFGIPTGRLAATGVPLRRRFPGTSLDDIITTMYTLAGEQNGRRYLLRFTGEGALEVVSKAETPGMELVRTMGVTNRWSVEDLCNSVAIYTREGQLAGREEDSASQALNGRLERAMVQKGGTDARAEAQAWLADHGLRQTVTAEILDPPAALRTGEAVLLRDNGSGAAGAFWVDGDTHTWRDGLHTGRFTLNFRNLMNRTQAGQEEKEDGGQKGPGAPEASEGLPGIFWVPMDPV